MPTISKSRSWCKQCQEWRLFTDENCGYCGKKFEPYKLSEISDEKIEAQRKRYKESKMKKLTSFLEEINRGGIWEQLMVPSGTEDVRIHEADAGQKKIDEKQREAYEKRKAELQALKEEYEAYKKLGRNDKCICGSDKKYKKCCLERFKGL